MSAQLIAAAITLPIGLALTVMGWRWTRLTEPPATQIGNAEHTRTIADPAAKLRAARRIGWAGVVAGTILLLVAGLALAQHTGLIQPARG